MNDADKAKAKAFQESYKGAKASREGIEEKFNAVRESIRAMIGCFLSNASKPESLKTLRMQSSIEQELKKILQESEARGREVWEPHSKGQGTSLKKLEREYDRLSNFYSTEGERCDTAI